MIKLSGVWDGVGWGEVDSNPNEMDIICPFSRDCITGSRRNVLTRTKRWPKIEMEFFFFKK